MTTGERIKQFRKQLGLTQEELGAKIGVGKAAINKYETGIVVNLKQSTINNLSKALGVSPVLLLGGSDSEVSLSPDEQELITLYRGADDRAKKDAIDTLRKYQKQDTSVKAI